MRKKINFKNYAPSRAWDLMYPLICQDFLFRTDYVIFAELIEEKFILQPDQWEYVLIRWEQKESFLSV